MKYLLFVIIHLILTSCATTNFEDVRQNVNNSYEPLISAEQEYLDSLTGIMDVETVKNKYPEKVKELETCYSKKQKNYKNCDLIYNDIYFNYWYDHIKYTLLSEVDDFCKSDSKILKKCENLSFKAIAYIEIEKVKTVKRINSLEEDKENEINAAFAEVEAANERRRRIGLAFTQGLQNLGQSMQNSYGGGGTSYSSPSYSNSYSGSSSNYDRGCINDYSCSYGYACVKLHSYDSLGSCMKPLDQYGNQNYFYNQNLDDKVLKECFSSLDCPTFWRCESLNNSFKRVCIK